MFSNGTLLPRCLVVSSSDLIGDMDVLHGAKCEPALLEFLCGAKSCFQRAARAGARIATWRSVQRHTPSANVASRVPRVESRQALESSCGLLKAYDGTGGE